MTATAAVDLAAISDVEIARLCADRNSAAVRHVLAANNQRLFRAAWSILRDRSEAEDAVQSGYMKAFAGMGGFEGRSALSTWLTRIVVNEAVARLRIIGRQREQLEAKGVAVIDTYRETLMRGSQAAAPDSELARRQLRALIERAVGELPVAFRSVFVLREVEGLSVEDTAETLGLPAATVKTRLLRARRKLQAALEPEVRSALQGVFPFAGPDCERMTLRVLTALRME